MGAVNGGTFCLNKVQIEKYKVRFKVHLCSLYFVLRNSYFVIRTS